MNNLEKLENTTLKELFNLLSIEYTASNVAYLIDKLYNVSCANNVCAICPAKDICNLSENCDTNIENWLKSNCSDFPNC